jgi:hypothetical protein
MEVAGIEAECNPDLIGRTPSLGIFGRSDGTGSAMKKILTFSIKIVSYSRKFDVPPKRM